MKNIKALTGLRAISALAVLTGHLPWSANPQSGTLEYFLKTLVFKFSIPNIGVMIFFSLSSFLLTYLALEEQLKTGNFSIKGFVYRRFVRIWPMYFLAVVLGWIFANGNLWFKAEYLYVLSFLSNWSWALVGFLGHQSFQPPPIAILWSLSVEEQFYSAFPFIAYFLLRLSTRRVIWLILACFLMGFISRYIYISLNFEFLPKPGAGGIYFMTFTYLDAFIYGAISAYIYFHRNDKKYHIYIEFFKKRSIFFVALFFIAAYFWEDYIWAPYSIGTLCYYSLIGLVCSMMVLYLSLNSDGLTFLTSAPLVYLGKISFGIFLWQIYAGELAIKLVSNKLLAIILTTIISIFFAIISYNLIERPLSKLKNKNL
jgi:peptidoglycan/LPS O-acetylase OafA/YrhL